MNTEVQEKSPKEMSTSELEALLAKKRKEEKEKLAAKKNKYEADKNNFLNESAETFVKLHNEMKLLKEECIAQANELYERMFRIEGKEPKETKSFTLKNTKDTVKVTVDRQERFEFTDEAVVHINAIKEIFREKFAQRNKGLYSILDGLLIKGKQGEYDPKLLAKARRQVRDLGDENLIAQFDKLDDCQRVRGTAMYCRLYVKDDKQRWQDVSLQFSSL